jgi:hypothetical protein
MFVRFEVFTAVTMKNGVFWDVTPFGSCKNRRFGGTWRLLHHGDKNHLAFLRSVRRLLVAACVVPSSPILVVDCTIKIFHSVESRELPIK